MPILSLSFLCYSHPRSLSSSLYWFYISNIKQFSIPALQSWLIYFKYQTTQNWGITNLVDIFQISYNSALHHCNLGWYISNIKHLRNWGITILVDIFQIPNNSELRHYKFGWYISNIIQLSIASLQSWLIYFKYQTTQELRHYNLGWYISNIIQLSIASLQSWLIYFKYQATQNCSITILVNIFQISNKSELQHYNLGWYISNIKQLRIATLQSWFIYFKYQTTQNCSITILVHIFQISNNSELQHYNLGWYISNVKQLRIALL